MNWSPLANHLWQSTLIAGIAALVALAFQHNRAQVRYRLWLAASLKFLLPFSLLLSLGHPFESPTEPPRLASAIAQVGQPFELPAAAPQAPAAPSILPLLGAVIWVTGCAFVLSRWFVRWRRVRHARRSSLRLPIPGPVEVRSTPARLEPGIFGVFRPVLLLPEGIADRLTPAQFQAILAHEFCHIRRRDNVTAALHMMVEAIFWFHPLVWWLGARLVEERERACDEEVVLLGSDREAYAAGILNVCKHYLESPLACASGVTGGDLKRRIEAIMTRRARHNLGPAGKFLLAAAAAVAIALPIAIGIAQAQTPPRFEVASIKLAKNAGGRGGMETLPGGGLRLGGTTLEHLITLAYDVRPEQVTGGPPWIRTEAYDILAKPEHADAGAGPGTAPGTTAWLRLRQRVQSLLTERFHLEVHRESKPASIYTLTIAKNGFKLQPVDEADQTPPGTMRSHAAINGRAGTMQMLATVLTGLLQRPVEDRTGLTGRYTYKLEYAADEPDAAGPSVFAALQEQLGLKLEATRGTVESIVVDRVQHPSAN